MRHTQDNDLSEVLEHIDPELFLEYEGVKYKRTFGSSGQQLNIKTCPRCGGNSWKVYLNAQTGLGNCFHGDCAGSPGFNIFSFARHLWGADPKETVRKLKDYARDQGWVAKRTTSVEVEEVADFDMPESIELPHKGRNLRYLESRGITSDLARYFHLRFCHRGQYIYIDQEGKRLWQNYDNRVLIPIYSLEGELVTFQGRTIVDAPRKYLFPPGLPGSGRFLYNGHNVIGQREVVIGEGAFDVIATKMALDTRVEYRQVGQIGTFGKHLSHGDHDGEDQLGAIIKLRNQGLRSVVFMWDGEAQAIADAIAAAKLVKSVGIDARVALLPEDKDPNEVPASEVIRAYETAFEVSSPKLMKELLKRKRSARVNDTASL